MTSGGCDGDPAVRASNEPIKARVSKLHIQESSWHEAILLKEDSKNLNWLNSMEDESQKQNHLINLLSFYFPAVAGELLVCTVALKSNGKLHKKGQLFS
ncbi:unnamed protein product [Musa acuminata var. zebrina]